MDIIKKDKYNIIYDHTNDLIVSDTESESEND